MPSGKIVPPKVFISYSHDSPEHADRVLDFSDRLREDGIDTLLDQYEVSPPEGWPRWMDRHIRNADFVLMICTQTYFHRVMGEEKPGKGLGVRWEGNIIYQHLYNAGTRNTRFIPVLFEGGEFAHIPAPIQGATFYPVHTPEGYDALYRALTNQPRAVKREPGKIRPLPPRERKHDFLTPGSATSATSDRTPNPFVWRQGITNAADFFDRDNEQRTLRNYLRNRQNCQIVGARRMGKTSLLRQVERAASVWESAALVAYLDLQDARCHTMSRWLGRAARQLGWPTPPQTLADFADGVEDMLSAGRRPVLCLDEFEEMTARRSEFSRDFFVSLRACGQQGMSIVTASQKPLSALTDPGGPASPFFNVFPLLPLGPFSGEDAEDFVVAERPGVPPFTPEEKTEILRFAAGRPLALQIACFHVLEARERGESLMRALQAASVDLRATTGDG